MKKIIKMLKKHHVSLPQIDYTGVYYEQGQGFRVFLIYSNECAEAVCETFTLWISKHYWNDSECSINEFVTEIEQSAYLEYFETVEEAIDYIENDYEPLDVIWKHSEEQIDNESSTLKANHLYLAPFTAKLLAENLDEPYKTMALNILKEEE